MRTSEQDRGQRQRPVFGLRRRPGRLALALFRLPLVLYRRGWGRLLGRQFMLLVHLGRKTGQPHAITAMVIRYDPVTGEVVILSAWGPEADWVRNLRVRPAVRVEIGAKTFTPQHRFLTEEESVEVARDFLGSHPHRVRLVCRILGWPNLRDETALRTFVRTHPFVVLTPMQTH